MDYRRVTWLAPACALWFLGACSQTPELPPTHDREWKPSSADSSVWNQYRGPRRDGIPADRGLRDTWAPQGPPLAWVTRGLGPGFASVAFGGNRVFTMGDAGGSSHLFALDAADGKIVWHARVGAPGGTRNAGPRSTPCTDGERVFGLGHDGELVCVRADSGQELWRRNLASDFGGRMMSEWGFSESPLIDGSHLVCTPGGSEGTVMAFDVATGDVAWRCMELTDDAAYSSLIAVEIGGVRQYIVLTGQSVAGIDARSGALLWRADRPGKTAICATPVYSRGVLFVTSGYGVGCNAFRITASDGAFDARQIYAGKQMQNHHGGVVLVGDHVYGIGRRNLKCIELESGRVVWESASVGKGTIAYADGHLVVRGERGPGTVAWVQATPDGYEEKGRFDPPHRSSEPPWAHPVIYDGRLYLRDDDALLCYDLRANQPEAPR